MKAYETFIKNSSQSTLAIGENSNINTFFKMFNLTWLNLLKDEINSSVFLTFISPNIVFSMENFQPRKDMKMLLHLVLLLI